VRDSLIRTGPLFFDFNSQAFAAFYYRAVHGCDSVLVVGMGGCKEGHNESNMLAMA
jgi:hypothetical protein